jgi:hypothetical protein
MLFTLVKMTGLWTASVFLLLNLRMLKKVDLTADEALDTSDDEEPLFCDPNFEDVELEVVVRGGC